MKGNNFEMGSDIGYESESLLSETHQALNEYKQELQNKNQYFEYKNRSSDGEYFVFSYNTITGERINDIKQKYVDQYGGDKEGIIVTDDKGHEIFYQEIKKTTKIYLKINRVKNPHPIMFYNVSFAGDKKYVCFIENYGRTPQNVRQMYQDQVDKVIPKEDFLLLDENNNPYDESVKFKPNDIINVLFKKSDSHQNTSKIEMPIEDKIIEEMVDEKYYIEDGKAEGKIAQEQNVHNVEPQRAVNVYSEMIEKQAGPITHGNRNNPEVSITFDDGYGSNNIRHILDTLKGSGINATFFILGDCLRNTPSLRKEAVEQGHQICCHTFSHIYLSGEAYTDLGDKAKGIKAGPGKLNYTNLDDWTHNVENLLGSDYLSNIKKESGSGFPRKVKSDILLRTEILMWEAQVKKTLGESYLNNMKLNHPFFRFPGGCGRKAPQNLAVLKELGYLSIGWSDDFYKGNGNSRRHMSTSEMSNMNISNGDIPLFHFKESDYKYINAYIENMKRSTKSSHLTSEIILPQ